jgi:hypothetical protein
MRYMIFALLLVACSQPVETYEDADVISDTGNDGDQDDILDADRIPNPDGDADGDSDGDIDGDADGDSDGDGDGDADGDGDGDSDSDADGDSDSDIDEDDERYCPPDRPTACGDDCMNLDNDPHNCGSCGRECPGRFSICIDGICHGYSECSFPGIGCPTCERTCERLGASCSTECYHIGSYDDTCYMFIAAGPVSESCENITTSIPARTVSCDFPISESVDVICSCCCQWE